MTYQLTGDGRGYLTSRDVLYYDAEGSALIHVQPFEPGMFVSLTMQKKRAYIEIENGAFELPVGMREKGTLNVTVTKTVAGRIVKIWECEPLLSAGLGERLESILKVEPTLIRKAEQEIVRLNCVTDGVRQSLDIAEGKINDLRERCDGASEELRALHARIGEQDGRIARLETERAAGAELLENLLRYEERLKAMEANLKELNEMNYDPAE